MKIKMGNSRKKHHSSLLEYDPKNTVEATLEWFSMINHQVAVIITIGVSISNQILFEMSS